MVEETKRAIKEYEVLPEGPFPCTDKPGYERVSAVISLPATLLDQLMNGHTGYRAHYAVSVVAGEEFNRLLVESIAPLIINACSLYTDKFSVDLCKNSLLGPYSKFWFTIQLTDPSAQDQLLRCPEIIHFPRWHEYWCAKQPPRKGLLAPMPEQSAVLFNGSFVSKAGTYYDQKHGRSTALFNCGWT